MTNIKKILPAIILAVFAAGAYLYPVMPDLMASHWGVDGKVDGYLPKFWALFLMPAITLAIYLFFLVLPKIDPLNVNYCKFSKYYDWFIAVFVFFDLYSYPDPCVEPGNCI